MKSNTSIRATKFWTVESRMCSAAQSWPTLCNPIECSLARLLRPWDSPGKNTGVGCHALLQGTFPTQASKLSLSHPLHWQMCSLPPVPRWEALDHRRLSIKILRGVHDVCRCAVSISRRSCLSPREFPNTRSFLLS